MLSLWHKSGLVVRLICRLNRQQMKRGVLEETQGLSNSMAFHIFFFPLVSMSNQPF
jgi:hypothetical protein